MFNKRDICLIKINAGQEVTFCVAEPLICSMLLLLLITIKIILIRTGAAAAVVVKVRTYNELLKVTRDGLSNCHVFVDDY